MQLPIPDIVDLLVYIFESVELKSEAYDKIKPTENLSRAKRFSKASDNNHNKCLCYVRYTVLAYIRPYFHVIHERKTIQCTTECCAGTSAGHI